MREDVDALMKRIWQQHVRDFDCKAASTWVSCDGQVDKSFTWQLDSILGPKFLIFRTWYLNYDRTRGWDHFPMITEVSETCQRVKFTKERKGLAGVEAYE